MGEMPMQAQNAYVEIATTRAREFPARLSLGLFIATAAWTFTGGWGPLIWFCTMAMGQCIDRLVSRDIRALSGAEPTAAQKHAYAFSVLCNATLYSSISAFTFVNGGMAGKLFGILIPAGALLNVALAMDRAPRAMIATWTPHVLFLLALPLIDGILTPRDDMLQQCFVAGGAFLFVVHVALAVRRIQQSSNALRAARDVAEAERVRAERASAAKSDFLATMSHEIRTPMNAVLASGALLRRTRLTRVQSDHVEMLANSSEMLMGILNDVLDLAKIESGKLTVEQAEFCLAEKLEAAVHLWRPRADERGVSIRFEPGALPQRIVTDPLRLQQIVFNLLSNAVKFTDSGAIVLRGGVIRRPGRDMVWIEVEDSGCGMTPEMCGRVFDSFEQASSGVTRTHGGTGLGLSISRRLAELMGGALTVTSHQGQGSIFRLETPLIEAAGEIAAEAAPEIEDQAQPAHLDVLLAEDHEVNQRIVRLILEPLGCTVTIAQHGAEAVAMANLRPYDIILMDMQMPVMGGVEASSCIRLSAGPNADTPILALTANVMDDHRAQWMAIGVDTFLTKPIDVQALITSVYSAAAGQAARKAA